MDVPTTRGTTIVSDSGEVMDFTNNQFKKYKLANIGADTADSLLEYVEKFDLKWEEGGVSNKSAVDYNRRRSKISWIDDDQLRDYVWGQFTSANQDPDWQFDITTIENIQFTHYEPSPTPDDSNPVMQLNGHYDWHSDEMIYPGDEKVVRKLSMTLVLNDGYVGGEFEFAFLKSHKIDYKALNLKKGDIVIFPSMLEHRVNPVKIGERKVIVCWAWGPLFK